MLGSTIAESAGADTANSRGTAITAGAGSKGSWVQLLAASAYDACGVIVHVSTLYGSAGQGIVDVGVGGAGAEVVLVPDLSARYQGTGGNNAEAVYSYFLPVAVPAGTRISARAQAGSALSVYVSVTLLAAAPGFPSGRSVTALLGTSATGVAVDPGAVAHTKGAYAQLSASTAIPIRWLVLMVGPSNVGAVAAAHSLIDIAIGAGGAEQVIIPNLYVEANITLGRADPLIVTLPVSIPAGTRVAARSQSDNTTSGDRQLYAYAWGVG